MSLDNTDLREMLLLNKMFPSQRRCIRIVLGKKVKQFPYLEKSKCPLEYMFDSKMMWFHHLY
jgi:hypothetical protein